MISPLDAQIGYLDAYLSHLKAIRWNQFFQQHLSQQGLNPRVPNNPSFGGTGLLPIPFNPFGISLANSYPQRQQVQPPVTFPVVSHWNSPAPEPVVQSPAEFPKVDHWNSPAPSDEESSRSPSPLREVPEEVMTGENNDDPELLALKKILRSLAIPFPNGIVIGRLNGEYKDLEGRDIPYHEYGKPTLTQFIKDCMKDVLYFSCDKTGQTLVKAYIDSDTAHVQQLVRGQRKVSKKRKPAVSRPLFNYHRRTGYGYGSNRPTGLAASNRTVGGAKLNTTWITPVLNPNLAQRPTIGQTQASTSYNFNQRPNATATRPAMRPFANYQPRPLTAEEKEKQRNLQLAKQKLSSASIPNNVRRQIFSFLKHNHPEPISVLTFAELWENKYKNTQVPGYVKTFEFKEYGFLTIFQALKSIPEIAEVTANNGPSVVSLSPSGLERLNEDEDTPRINSTSESTLPDINSLKIKSEPMTPPLNPIRSLPTMSAGCGRGLRRPSAIIDDMPPGYCVENTRPPPLPTLRRLGQTPPKPVANANINTEEELFEYLKQKTGIDDMEILKAMTCPEKTEFYLRKKNERKQLEAEQNQASSFLPTETLEVFKSILESDQDCRGIPVTVFLQKYKTAIGCDLNPQSFGLGSPMEVLKSTPETIYIPEQQEAVEANKYPSASDTGVEFHVYDAKRYFAIHPERAPHQMLLKFNPILIEVTNKLVATFVSLNGSNPQISIQQVESKYKELFREMLDLSQLHFSTLFSVVKVLMCNIAQIIDVCENDNVKQNHVLFMKPDGLRTWFVNKLKEEDGFNTIKKILTWSKTFLIDECVIFPSSNEDNDCLLKEREIPDEGLTRPDDHTMDGVDVRWHSVVICSASSPRSFYVNLGQDRKQINKMMDEFNDFYNPGGNYVTQKFPYSHTNGADSSYDVPDFLIRPGMLVAAKFIGDQSYQRSLVMNCDNLDYISVKYVDFGGSATFQLKDLRLMNKYFIETYPQAFALKVALFGICPPLSSSFEPGKPSFDSNARQVMLAYSDHDKKIAGAFLTRKYPRPPKSGLKGLRAGRMKYECILCDVTELNTDRYIHEELVEKGFACRVPAKLAFKILDGTQTEEEVFQRIVNRSKNH